MERVRSNTAVLILIALLSILIFQACGDSEIGLRGEGVRPNDDGEITVVLRNFAFEPDTLVFEVGQTVEFTLSSSDSLHSFTVRDLDINWVVKGKDEPITESFVFSRPGKFKLICAIPGHQASRMVGTVEVMPKGGSVQ